MNNATLINFGNQAFIKGDYDEAIEYYQKVSQGDENLAIANVNLANTYLTVKNYELAINYARKTLELDSNSYLAHIILGNAYLAQEQYTDSLFHLQQALNLDSNDAWLYNSLSQVYQKISDFAAAIDAAMQAIELSNCADSQAINIGYLLYETALEKGRDFVIPSAQKLLDYYGKNSIINHMCNSLLQNDKITSANLDFVANIFDVFAPDFEDVLQKLDYAVPELIAQKMDSIHRSDLRILDAGCGTGLCAKYLTPYVKNGCLIGVDISSKMIAEAHKKSFYNQLVVADLLSYLNDNSSAFDVIVAADVLTYFGQLDEVIALMAKSLVKDGQIIFSITENKMDSRDYVLHFSGRFLHSQDYLQKLLTANHFKKIFFTPATLRVEGDQPVKGWIISACLA